MNLEGLNVAIKLSKIFCHQQTQTGSDQQKKLRPYLGKDNGAAAKIAIQTRWLYKTVDDSEFENKVESCKSE